MLFQLTSTFNFTFLVYFRYSHWLCTSLSLRHVRIKTIFFSFQEYNFPGETLWDCYNQDWGDHTGTAEVLHRNSHSKNQLVIFLCLPTHTHRHAHWVCWFFQEWICRGRIHNCLLCSTTNTHNTISTTTQEKSEISESFKNKNWEWDSSL